MKTGIKVFLLKVVSFLTALGMVGFGFVASFVILVRSSEILLEFHYTEHVFYAILAAIGITLMWLVSMLSDSAEWIMRGGFEKAAKLEGENNE
jgi:hypothetical protein